MMILDFVPDAFIRKDLSKYILAILELLINTKKETIGNVSKMQGLSMRVDRSQLRHSGLKRLPIIDVETALN